MFGNVWECLRSAEALGISRASVVRFAERLRGCALYHTSPGISPIFQKMLKFSLLINFYDFLAKIPEFWTSEVRKMKEKMNFAGIFTEL